MADTQASPSQASPLQHAVRQAVTDQLQAWGFDAQDHSFTYQHLSGNGQVITTLAQVNKIDRIHQIAAEDTRYTGFMNREVADQVNAALLDYYKTDERNITANNAKHPIIERLGFSSILELVDTTLLSNLKQVAAHTVLQIEATSEPRRERQ